MVKKCYYLVERRDKMMTSNTFIYMQKAVNRIGSERGVKVKVIQTLL